MAPVMRCKMKVEGVVHQKDGKGNTVEEQIRLFAVVGGEGSPNADWSKWTPSANFYISVTNPRVFGKVQNGQEFYVDLVPVNNNREEDE